MDQLSGITVLSLLIACFQLILVSVLLYENRASTRRLAYLVIALFSFSLGSFLISQSWIPTVAKHLRFLSLFIIPFLLYGYMHQVLTVPKKWTLLIPSFLLGFCVAMLAMTMIAHYHGAAFRVITGGDILHPIISLHPSTTQSVHLGAQVVSVLLACSITIAAFLNSSVSQRKSIQLRVFGLMYGGLVVIGMVVFRSETLKDTFFLNLSVLSTGLAIGMYCCETSDEERRSHATMMFETLQDGLLLLGEDERILDISPKAKSYMRDLDDSFIGRTLAQASACVDLLRAYTQHQNCSATAQGTIIEVSQDNKTLFYEIRQFKAGNAPFSVLIIRDMTECFLMKQMIEERNEQLDKANKLKSMLIEIMAHDFRSPLVAMKSMQQLLTTDSMTKDSPIWCQTHAELDALIDRADSLLNNLLSLSIISESKHTYPLSVLDIQTILNAIPKVVKQYADAKGVQLVFSCEDNALVYGNAYLCTIVIRNVLENAIKYSPPSQHVTLSVSIEPQTVLVVIENAGTPIAKEALIAFSKDAWGVCTVGTAGEKGPGLGLYATKQFLHYMGGELFLHSDTMKHTCITIQLERVLPTERRKAPNDQNHHS